MLSKFKLQFDSLRFRSWLFVCVASILFIIISLVSQHQVKIAGQNSAGDLLLHNRVIQLNRDIKNALWETKVVLDAFLLTADNKSQHQISHQLEQTQKLIWKLDELPKLKDIDHAGLARQLTQQLQQLKLQIDSVILIRLDANKQYPALKIMTDYLDPSMVSLSHNLTSLFDEIQGLEDTEGREEIYRLVETIRYNWLMMVSSFRLYIMVRFGAVSAPSIEGRVYNVNLYYQALMNNIAQLKKIEEEDKLDLFFDNVSETLENDINLWLEGFIKINLLHVDNKWRSDYPLLINHIEPEFKAMWQKLTHLDTVVEQATSRDISLMKTIADNIVLILWGAALSFIAAMILGFIYFDRVVLRTISKVGQALVSGDVIEDEHLVINARIRETQQLVNAFRKMQEKVRQREQALEYQADHDALTGLSNRNLFKKRIDDAIESAHKIDGSFAVIFMDLDHFKEINDSLGHHAGDEILVQVSERLLSCMRKNDTIARLGGDEFAIVLPGASKNDVDLIVNKITAALKPAFAYRGHELFIGASMGIALYPQDSTQTSKLLQCADIAMYMSKRKKQGCVFYDPAYDENSLQNLKLIQELRYAIEHNELMLFYQPKQLLGSADIIGVEALLRWKHPERGMIAPNFIVEIAERSGLIDVLTLWVLRTSLLQQKKWINDGVKLQLSVNLSVWNIQETRLVHQINNILLETGADPGMLILEITESAMMTEPEMARLTMLSLAESGIKFSVDDYGTGYSSLAYLKQLPVDELKIDRSFVKDMLENANDAVIVSSTIDLAHNLGMKVVAEGIEEQQVFSKLAEMGCDIGQGYFITEPLPEKPFMDWLKQHL